MLGMIILMRIRGGVGGGGGDHGGAGGGLVALWIIYNVVLYEMLCMWTLTLP